MNKIIVFCVAALIAFACTVSFHASAAYRSMHNNSCPASKSSSVLWIINCSPTTGSDFPVNTITSVEYDLTRVTSGAPSNTYTGKNYISVQTCIYGWASGSSTCDAGGGFSCDAIGNTSNVCGTLQVYDTTVGQLVKNASYYDYITTSVAWKPQGNVDLLGAYFYDTSGT
jgi:hypothetical protein